MIPASRRKTGKSKKAVIGIATGAVALTGITAAIVLFMADDTGQENTSADEATSEYQVMTEQDDFMEGADTGHDIEQPLAEEIDKEAGRKQEYYVDFVDLSVLQNGGGIFDVHIRFPDGEDYVVVKSAAIYDITEEGFFVSLSDRENHMMSSAQTDIEVYAGATMYLSRYGAAASEAATADYPWNQFVLGAHGADETDAEEVYARRVQLEENLAQFMNQTLNR